MEKIWIFIKTNLSYLYAVLLSIFLFFGFFNNTFLKIIIWPSLLIVFAISFKNELSKLINRIIGVKLPGGGEFLMHQETISDNSNSEKIAKEYAAIVQQKEGEIEKKQQEHELTNEQYIKEIALRDVIIGFERIYNAIFKSQLDFLWELSNNKNVGLNKSQIEAYFDKIKSSAPWAYYNWAWQNYINFLCRQNLIVMNENGNFIITDYGLAFLEYISSMNYQKYALI